MLKDNIKKQLLEVRENKEKKLIESTLVKNRLKFLIESVVSSYSKKSSETKKIKLFFNIVNEVNSLNDDNLINEDLGNVFKTIFGQTAFGGVFKDLYTSLITGILNKMGVKDEILKNSIINYSSENLDRLTNSLSSCEELTKLISEAISNAFVIKTQNDQEENVIFSKMKDILSTELKNPSVITKIQDSLKDTVCQIFEEYTNKANDVLNALKNINTSSVKDIQIQ